ncbi:hypothetical protein GQ54DRAFT_315634 [Martensiomyces pterosporus]|nr:hypothetical protein GQ54DRAFT_315634 [Martensiomyces pterosporus]
MLGNLPSDAASSGYQADVYNWQFSGASLSVARSSIAATSVGSLAFFAGGRLQNDSYTDVVDIYDRSTNKWSVSHLSMTRSLVSAGSIAGRYAVFAGGFDSSFQPLDIVDVYDVKTRKWSVIRLSMPRAAPKIMDLGHVTAIIGGLSGDLQYLSKTVDYVDAHFEISTGSLGVEYPQFGLAIADATRSGSGLYTSGYQNNRPGERFNDFEASNQTIVFTADSSAVSFATGPVFPYPRWGAGGGAANGIFAVGGGYVYSDSDTGTLTTIVDRVDIYDAASGKWCDKTLHLSVPRDYPLVQTVGDYVLFFSGTEESKDFDILDTRSKQFITNPQHRPSLYTLRSNAAATTVDDCLVIVAGGLVYQGHNATSSVEMFNACK